MEEKRDWGPSCGFSGCGGSASVTLVPRCKLGSFVNAVQRIWVHSSGLSKMSVMFNISRSYFNFCCWKCRFQGNLLPLIEWYLSIGWQRPNFMSAYISFVFALKGWEYTITMLKKVFWPEVWRTYGFHLLWKWNSAGSFKNLGFTGNSNYKGTIDSGVVCSVLTLCLSNL